MVPDDWQNAPAEAEQHEPELHFTIMHAIGIVLLLAILEALVSLLLSMSKLPELDTSAWLNLCITKIISGSLAAQAGAVLTGASLAFMLGKVNVRVEALLPLLAGVFGISFLSSEFTNLLQWIGHVHEGNDMGEVILLKRWAGRPYCAVSPRYAKSAHAGGDDQGHSSGRLSGPSLVAFDSAVAAWRMMRRGLAVDFLFCNLAGAAYERQVLQVAKVLTDLWPAGARPRARRAARSRSCSRHNNTHSAGFPSRPARSAQ